MKWCLGGNVKQSWPRTERKPTSRNSQKSRKISRMSSFSKNWHRKGQCNTLYNNARFHHRHRFFFFFGALWSARKKKRYVEHTFATRSTRAFQRQQHLLGTNVNSQFLGAVEPLTARSPESEYPADEPGWRRLPHERASVLRTSHCNFPRYKNPSSFYTS